jgi:hypothetical protein
LSGAPEGGRDEPHTSGSQTKEQIMYRTATIAAALATLAVAAPLAAAQPLEHGYVAPKHVAVAPAAIGTSSDSGFDWLDAAIGATVAAGVLTITGTGVLAARRPREDTDAAFGAD